MKKDITVVLDGNSLAYRAFYALPNLRNSAGDPCGAVFGFCKMILHIITKLEPKYIVVAFDAGKHTFRHNFFNEYKGTRKPTPEELKKQFGAIKNLLQAMNIKYVEIPEIEADDIIGSVSKQFEGEKILVSGDRDLLQLVSDDTQVWLTKKGMTEILEVNAQVLMQEFGVTASEVIDKKAIMGDSSDNIPGVRGIGATRALSLIQKYHTLDNIYEHIDEITGKTKEYLIDGKDMAYLSRLLGTIRTNVKLTVDRLECEYDFPFNNEVYNMLKYYEFKSIISQTEYFNLVEAKDATNTSYNTMNINTLEDFEKLYNEIIKTKEIGSYVKDDCWYVSNNDIEYLVDLNLLTNFEGLNITKKILSDENILKIMFDVKSDMHFFEQYNIEINNYFDVSLAIYLVNESENVTEFEKVELHDNLNFLTPASNLKLLKDMLLVKLEERNQIDLYYDIELKLVKVLYDMETVGVAVDLESIKQFSAQYKEELEKLKLDIYKSVNQEFNLNSPKQLSKILFEDLKLTCRNKKNTAVETLEEMINQHEVISLILRYRKISKLVSTYLEGMLPYVKEEKNVEEFSLNANVNNKIHTTFTQTYTSTGRLSSREPNLQNIPIRDEESKILRAMFIPSHKNGKIMSADYNQIELRLMAIFSKDEHLLADFKNKIDVHSAVASKIFNIDVKDVKSSQRRIAKAVNFGIIYGISSFGLAKNINSTRVEAQEFIDRYFQLYPDVKKYMENSIEIAREKGYAQTFKNRIRHIPELTSSNFTLRTFGERVALNMPLQGSASDIIKMAMINVHNALEEKRLKSKIILQIHDEILLDVYPGEEKICEQILEEYMVNIVNFELPLEVSIGIGDNWLECK